MRLYLITTLLFTGTQSVCCSKKEESYEDLDEVSDQEVEAFLTTVIFVGILTIFLFTIFQRTRATNTNENPANANSARMATDPATAHIQRQRDILRQAQLEQQMQFQRRRNNTGGDDEDITSIPMPPPDSKHKLLLDGVLPFRHGDAKDYKLEVKQKNSKQDVIAASLGSYQLSRGCNIVLTIKGTELFKIQTSPTDVSAKERLESICNAITVLGSEYNLFLILDFENENADNSYLKQVRDTLNSVPSNVLPKHRIVEAKCVTGRVAFVRQLRPELVVDHDIEVQKQLTRFGFKVHIYGNGTGGFGRLCQLVI